MASFRVYRLVYETRQDGKQRQRQRTDSGPGSWFVEYSDQFGRRRREATKATTKREAEALGREKLSAIVKAQIIGVNNPEALSMPFAEFVTDLFLPHVRTSRRPGTVRHYEEYAAHAIGTFGPMNMRAIQEGDVQRYLDALASKGTTRWGHPMAPATINRRRAFLVTVFTEAKRRKYVSENPASGARKLREDNERTRYASEWEEEQIMAHAEAWLRPIVKLATLAGLRLGEIITLRWDQIDKERGAVRILPTSKGHKGREVPIAADLWPWLRELAPFVGKQGRSVFVFVDPETEKPYPEHRVQAAYARAIREANIALQAAAQVAGSKAAPVIEDLHFHDLRRTFASRLAQKGVSLQTIADLLGHSAVYVTLRYSYLQPENLRAAVALLNKGGVAKNLPSGVALDGARTAVSG